MTNPSIAQPPENELIYAYTRKQAIEDGLQAELSQIDPSLAEMAKQIYKFPVYLTSSVTTLIEMAVSNPKQANDLTGVVWDILWMSTRAARPLDERTVAFTVIITGTGRKRNHQMIAQCGPIDIDDTRPCVTIMLPDEL